MKQRIVKTLYTVAASTGLFVMMVSAGLAAFIFLPVIIWKEYRSGKQF